jgi:hypothetical protein
VIRAVEAFGRYRRNTSIGFRVKRVVTRLRETLRFKACTSAFAAGVGARIFNLLLIGVLVAQQR